MSGCDAFLSPQLSRQDRGRGKARQGKARQGHSLVLGAILAMRSVSLRPIPFAEIVPKQGSLHTQKMRSHISSYYFDNCPPCFSAVYPLLTFTYIVLLHMGLLVTLELKARFEMILDKGIAAIA